MRRGVSSLRNPASPLSPPPAPPDLPGPQRRSGCEDRPERGSTDGSLSLQVIQEVSGLPPEGASEGNQYTPDAQRPNCPKVSLCPAWRRARLGFSSVTLQA